MQGIYQQNRNAEGSIIAYSIVKEGASDFGALQAAGPNDAIIGVNGEIAASSTDPVDVIRLGPAFLTAGGTITRGDRLTSDANGKAVTASESIVQTAVVGAAAGNVTVTGIKTTDTLISVLRLDRDSTAANINETSLTGEFTISAADTINNTGGTNTTGDVLIVAYRRNDRVIAIAEQSAVSGDIFRAFVTGR